MTTAAVDLRARVTGPAPVDDDPRAPHARLRELFDEGDCRVLGNGQQGEVLAAAGAIGEVFVVAFASDVRVKGGAMTSLGCAAIVDAYELALREGAPIVGLWRSDGARSQEGVASLHGVGRIFAAMTRASGVIPQVSVVLGPAAGGGAYGAALTDVVVMCEADIFVTAVHGGRGGVAHVVVTTRAEAIGSARRVVGLLCAQGRVHRDSVDDVDFSVFLPTSLRRAYDVRPMVNLLLDESGLELQPRWAPNIVTTLGRLGGRTVGIVANNPLRLAGGLDSRSAEKAARFVRMCDAFGVPMIVVVDVPGYLPGAKQEWDGVVRRGAKLLHAFAGCVVPRWTLITRKAYDGAYLAMNGRSLGATKVFAWPAAEIPVMNAVAELGALDEVIAPERTRSVLAGVLAEAP